MKVYISGPITGVEDFKKCFAEAEQHLAGVGYSVLNPAAFNSVLPKGFEYEDYMKLDFALIEIADMVYMLPGWENSRGTKAEYHYAEVLGKTIWFGK